MAAKKRLGEMLIEAGVIDESQLRAALGYQRQWGVRLGQALVEMKLATEPDVVRALAQRFGYEVAQVGAATGYPLEQALKLVPRDFAAKHNVVPLAADAATLTVAMSEPGNVSTADELRFRTGRRVKICIGGDREIADAIRRLYPGDQVEPIALDLDAGEEGEPVLDPFGGGSKDDLEAFFGQQPAAPAAAPPPAPAPPAPAPANARPITRSGIPAVAAPPPAPASRPITRSGLSPVAAPPAPAMPRPLGVQAPPPPSVPAAPAPPAHAPAPQASPAPRAAPPAPRAAPAPPPPAPRSRTLLDDLDLEVPAKDARRPAASAAPPAPRPAAPPAAVSPARVPKPAPAPEAPAPEGEPILATDLAPEGDPGALDARELALLDALGRMAAGGSAEPELVKPAQAVAALLRLLLRKKLVTEEELLEELTRR
jgi:hypothetical protein